MSDFIIGHVTDPKEGPLDGVYAETKGTYTKFKGNLIKNAAKNGYTRFVEPCAGTFAMSNLAIQNGYKPEQIETSDVSMMSSVMGYAITGKPLDELEIHAQGFGIRRKWNWSVWMMEPVILTLWMLWSTASRRG